ncbi:hypothetical protein MVEG_11264 [Podila verticillata NRRL 6337]|uniref:NADP-dependent oxidoreductase domain-containing protein n=1 Tax=Podila verticillata NRRL 6337 TaxID=1069443 RepID=A0A086TLB0_9FUNG|nr:hypothetical protein MVEG_11264 [Podila verticillata NRRL 6337]
MASPTSRAISRLGIGSYRLALGVPEHEKILYKALERQSDPQLNINLIDTSSNYSNGRSEQLIGKVLSHPHPNTLTREEIVIATKFGYIQNENMRLLSEGVYSGVPANEIVKYSRECYHCIHPEFMRDQLTRSLERLNTKFADILFIHNPEYFLMSTVRDVKDIEVNVKKHQNILLERLATLFEALEREIEKGRIRAYGISSNSFSLKPSNAHFLPYEGLVKMAAAAFEKVRGQKQQEHDRYKENLQLLEKERAVSAATEETNTIKPPSPSSKATSTSTSTSHHMKHPTAPQPTKRTTHGLGFLQMPGNLLEMEGVLRTAKWAKGQGLRVFINRPLNAMSPEYGAVRLASYPEPQSPTYEQAHRHLLDTLSTLSHHRAYLAPNMQRLTEDIEELDSTLKANNLSAIHLEGVSIRNQLHQELSKRIKHKPGVSTSATVPQPEGEVSERLSQPIVKETHPSPPSTSTTPSPSSSHMASDHELEGVIKLMDKYIHAFQQQVRFQETGRVSAMLAERGIDLEGESIEQFAIEYLLEHEQVDAVLLGMKREPYVDFARKTLQRLAQGSSSS